MLRNAPWIAKVGLGITAALVLLLAACSEEPPSAPLTLIVPSRIAVNWVDVGGVYDAVAAYAQDGGLPIDPSQSAKATATYTSQRVRCAPNGSDRHTAWCIFRFTVTPAPDNPQQTAVNVKVVVPERVDYDQAKLL